MSKPDNSDEARLISAIKGNPLAKVAPKLWQQQQKYKLHPTPSPLLKQVQDMIKKNEQRRRKK